MTTVAAAAVEKQKQARVYRGPRASMKAQRRLMRLLNAVGCETSTAGRHVGVSAQAAHRWLLGQRPMLAPHYAKLVALLPWCVVNAQMQAAGRMDSAALAELVKIERAADELVNAALADATIGPAVREHWSEINAALRSPAGREMLDALARRYALARPKGPAA